MYNSFLYDPRYEDNKARCRFIKSLLQKEFVGVLSTLMNPLCDFVLTQRSISHCLPLYVFSDSVSLLGI